MAFVSFILLAMYLGTKLPGVFNHTFALTASFIPLCDIGMDVHLMRQVPRFQAEEVAKQLEAVHSWEGMLTFLVTILSRSRPASSNDSGTDRFSMVVLAGLTTLLRTYWTTLASCFRAINSACPGIGIFALADEQGKESVRGTLLQTKCLHHGSKVFVTSSGKVHDNDVVLGLIGCDLQDMCNRMS